jgi:aerobic-type carbon monoxide dehydrogenase small subunit (CoxS/CutS family)
VKPVSLHYERPESVEEAGALLLEHDLLERGGPPTREEIVDTVSGHLCRCTGYEPIVGALALAAKAQ